MSVSRGEPAGEGRRVAVIVARFHEQVTGKLLEGALAGLRAHGVAEGAVDVAWVPGAFEILATDTLDQAEARAGGIHGNKGWEAAAAALEMASVLDLVSEAGSG